jgi:hypothetical protein
MINKMMLRLVVVLGLFAVFMTMNANIRPVYAQSCDSVTDQQIVTEIYSRINADKGLASQVSHINVISIYKVVKLQGWVTSQRDFDKVVEIASSTDCVRMINSIWFRPAAPDKERIGGCSSGMKACGDICIPEGDACNIMAKPSGQ